MTFEEAKKIYNNWHKCTETFDKLIKIFRVVPESFFPYSVDILKEALNIVAKYYFESGDKKMAINIQETLMYQIGGYYFLNSKEKSFTDKEVLMEMKKDLDQMFEHPKLLEAKLESLKKSRDSWAKMKTPTS